MRREQIGFNIPRFRDELARRHFASQRRGALVKRYTAELNDQEDNLASVAKELDGLTEKKKAAQEDFSRKIDALSLDLGV